MVGLVRQSNRLNKVSQTSLLHNRLNGVMKSIIEVRALFGHHSNDYI